MKLGGKQPKRKKKKGINIVLLMKLQKELKDKEASVELLKYKIKELEKEDNR